MTELALYIWIFLGVALIVLEFIVPGLVVVFFGAAALIVALFISLGFFPAWQSQIFVWAVLSLLLILALRRQFRHWFPSLEEIGHPEESLTGEIVEVLEEIPAGGEGRVRFQGTSWKARSEQSIAAGEKVKITGRDNIILHVSRH
ncbi:MAG: NfeD family protein [Spirochaetales bacterium]|nr:NfeD family protein [Spirochaetales bacterium]